MIRKGLTHQIPSAIETGAKDGMVTMKQSLDKLKEEELI
jgi:Tfp pilus assembly pilus retraction ATPase PilT